MAEKKIIKELLILLIFLSLLIFDRAYSQNLSDWQSYTSTSEVRHIDYFEDSVQAVTSGGWLKIDPVTNGLNKITNVDGLGTGNLYDIFRDNAGNIWLAGFGRLIKYVSGNFVPYLFFNRADKLMTLYSLEDDANMIWVGTSEGLALFSKSKNGGQIEDFYFRFGDLNPEPAIYDIKIVDDFIWLATSAGLAVADKSNPDLLKSYINWTTFSSGNYPELVGDTISTLAYYNGAIYLGTKRNAYRIDINGMDTSLFKIPTREPAAVNEMVVQGDTLAIYTSNGFFLITPNGLVGNNTPSIPSSRFLSGHFINGGHWVGLKSGGIYHSSGGSYSHLADGGLPVNYVTAIIANANGTIAGGFQRNGVALFDGANWNPVGINEIIAEGVREGVRALAFDNQNNLWAGTWGNGLMLITPDTIINFDEGNSTLRGVLENPGYVVVNDLAMSSDYLFMINYRSYIGTSVSVVDLNDLSNWRSFDRSDSLTSEFPVSIDYYNGTFAVGTQFNGVYTYYCGENPFLETGALAINLKEDNSRLGSNTVNVVRFDNSGVLWVGTKFGLSRYDEGIPRFDNLVLPSELDPAVTSLIFDGRNNAWIGTRNGLAFYNTISGEYTIYNTLNSGLTDNQINSLVLDPVTGDLWIGTPSGLSRLKSQIGPPSSNLEQVIAFPNPFIIRNGAERLGFNYDGEATVRIYSSNGELVREMAINIPWDGKNQNGRDVASGVYLILISKKSGETGQSKVMLIRD